MKAAVLTQYGKIKWEDVPDPVIRDSQVLVKVSYAGICGSDQHIFKGDFHPRTRIPMIPGHEFAGTIFEVGKKVKSIKSGEKVVVDPIIWCGECPACRLGQYPACTFLKLLGVDLDGGFAEYVAVNEEMVYKVNPKISDKHATLTEVYSIGFHACRRANLQKTDTLAIWGAGKIGQSILQAARTKTSGTIFMIDILENRLKIATDNYSDIVAINYLKEDPVALIKEHTKGRGVDIAFEAIGHAFLIKDRPHPVRGCIQSIRGAGTVCVLGLADEPAPIIMKELIWKEARIVASRVSQGEFSEAIHHLELGHLKPEILISDVIPGSSVQKAFQVLEEEPEHHLKILLKFS
jgi:threonine dehydrogenase-like Zn-dependent dehydrogenase